MATTKTKTSAKPSKKAPARKTSKVSSAVMKARATRNEVTAGGKRYPSVRKAFGALRLPIGRHARFRKLLKAAGKLTFDAGSRKVLFSVVKG